MTTILITGANRGLGLGLTRSYAEQEGTSIIACCRSPVDAEELQALSAEKGSIQIEALDVADEQSIAQLGERLTGRPIDILINNAGIFGKNPPATTGFTDQTFGKSDFEADWIAPFRTNVIGPMKIVESLIENIAASHEKKVVIVTSIIGSISSAHGFMFGYAASKAAANMTAKNLSVALKPQKIIVNPLHPGYVKTDMSGEGADIDVAESISGMRAQIDSMTMEKTGCFLSYDGNELPW
ncbi:MAG: SDR family oxidoreductase [Sphingorhabdus sp.]